MLIGLATLISILFFGGVSETFLVDKLEKGVKHHIANNETRKEILADLKLSKKYIKAFDKNRSARLKSFEEMNADRNAKREEMDIFFDLLRKERLAFQEHVIADRIKLAKKIGPDEWTLILAVSEESVEKRNAKQQKKIDKDKISPPFKKTSSIINEKINDSKRKENLLAALQRFIDDLNSTVEELNSMNVLDNEIISNREADKQQLLEVGNNLNKLRQQTVSTLIDFHFLAKENTTEDEWKAVMKSFNKELSITSH